MHLKRLDLQGFKSFPEKITLDFNEGVTAVVGPNGSGKSNISDAIRWVLGEQRAKHLRGDKMEDVIFMGTENRRKLSFAEVSITLDNTDQTLPLDYTEVKITRRVSRDGESDYSINGSNARLKDIQELFMDTGIGKEGYSIISQGRIDQILSSKGEERRKLFEEATGIGKHKTRRHEALMKLEKEQQNLMRVKDIIAELEVQIQPLEEQSAKAREFLALKESLKEVEIVTFINELNEISTKNKDINAEKTIRNKELGNLQRDIISKKVSVNMNKERVKKLEEKIQILNDKIVECSTEHEKKKGEIHLNMEQQSNETKNKHRLLEEIENKKGLLESLQDENKIAESRIMALNLEKNNMEIDLADKEKSFLRLDKNLSTKTNTSETAKDEINQKLNKSTELKGDVTKNEALKEQIEVRQKQVMASQESYNTKILEQKTHVEALKKHRTQKNDETFGVQNELKNLTNKYEQLDIEKDKCRESIIKEENIFIDMTSRIKLLEEMEQEKEGFVHSVKSILNMKNRKEKGVCGAVGELFQAKEKYENSLETAFGNSIQNIIVETEEDAKNAINYLKNKKLGRGTFLPISAVKGKSIDKKENIFDEKNVLGLASDFVEYDTKYKEICLSLLGRTIIIKDLESGVHLSRKYKHKYRMVTLDGDMFNSGGAITGGSSKKRSVNILGRSAEIATIKKQLAEKEKSIENLRAKREDIRKSIEENTKNQELKKEALQQFSIDLTELKKEIEVCENSISDYEKELSDIESELKEIVTQFNKINKEIDFSSEALSDIEESMEVMQQKLSEDKDSLYTHKEEHKVLGDEITELRITLSGNIEKINGVIDDKKRLEKELLIMTEGIENAEKDLEKLADKNVEKNTQQAALEQEEKEIATKFDELEIERENNINEKNSISELIEKSVLSLESKQEESGKTEQEIVRLDSILEKNEENKTRIINSLWDEYELTPREAKEHWERRLELPQEQSAKELRNQIKILGDVNVSSIETYKEVKERYTILTSQQTDILEGEKKLYNLIEELTVLMQEQFKEQFAVISENFSQVFKELFGNGGVGYLKLSDGLDILESPIEIIAQPPGKKLQNMQLLSGGERALTAIALLFGILRMKPSPFCVLDEIEAALDDANVDRYGKYLKKFAKTTQFIVITHRKGTMEHSDVLYGVTMEEKGISKLISVDFSDNIDGVI